MTIDYTDVSDLTLSARVHRKEAQSLLLGKKGLTNDQKRFRVEKAIAHLTAALETMPGDLPTEEVLAETADLTGKEAAEWFAIALSEKFGKQFAVSNGGVKYHRVYVEDGAGSADHVHAFVGADGGVYKAEGWKKPAAGVRFATVAQAIEAADLHGSYLYQK